MGNSQQSVTQPNYRLTKEQVLAHNRLSTKTLVVASFLVALNIVLTRIGAIMLAGGTIRLSFGNMPLALSGMLLGPGVGAMVGFVSDILGFMINSHGSAFHPGFTLSNVLTGMIPGIVVMFSRKKLTYFNVILSNLLIMIIVSLGLNTYWLTHLFDQAFIVLLPTRILASIILTVINTIMICVLIKSFSNTNVFTFEVDHSTSKRDMLYVTSFILPFIGLYFGHASKRSTEKERAIFGSKLFNFSLKVSVLHLFVIFLYFYEELMTFINVL
ncbi:folate family ECF transporter S component [Serpentinicella sp. ANB-PHB4]|uniref:folate family ECF transporter S component n=1 Tax=Serpentinicella sp. ANB-PHB4 TaxID=3074076 RepID=UPI002859537E|nr:folate family ECF transporter S component [Serpentinicella sp. ANB-PHB4]MDR5659467.1 folate family ECF transporter S component [Serpentinicella sp. ANB-PHB4]